MKVLFIGRKFGNSYHQYQSLKINYKKVDLIDTEEILPFPWIAHKIFHHISPFIFEFIINKKILIKVKKKYDLIYVKSGELIGKDLILKLKKKTKKIVFFCNDNPFVSRDKQRWMLFLSAAKYYDLIVYQDISRIKLAKKIGLKNSLLVLPPYDKRIHKQQKISKNIKRKFKSDVVFIGTWYPERGVFFKKLIDLGLNIKIYGSRWYKDPNYNFLKSNIRLGHFAGSKYSKIIQNSKIALCLFAVDNLDTITARSMEITAIGTLMCSFRTAKMKKTFVENKEAIYFSSTIECFKKCQYFLNNPKLSKKIAKKGNIKVCKILNANNDMLIRKIFNKVFNNRLW